MVGHSKFCIGQSVEAGIFIHRPSSWGIVISVLAGGGWNAFSPAERLEIIDEIPAGRLKIVIQLWACQWRLEYICTGQAVNQVPASQFKQE